MDVSPPEAELSREGEHSGIRVGVAESSRVRDESGHEGRSHGGREIGAGGVNDRSQKLGRGRGFGMDHVRRRAHARTGVVIHVDAGEGRQKRPKLLTEPGRGPEVQGEHALRGEGETGEGGVHGSGAFHEFEVGRHAVGGVEDKFPAEGAQKESRGRDRGQGVAVQMGVPADDVAVVPF